MAINLDFSISGLTHSLLTNPLNWALTALVISLARLVFFPPERKMPDLKLPDVRVLQDLTPRELVKYDGKNGQPIFIAVNRRIYDVSRGAGFYGPGGPYSNFAGHDASRGLAKNSFDPEMLTDINGPIDKLDDLTGEERHSLAEWADMFEAKYDYAGQLVENKERELSPK